MPRTLPAALTTVMNAGIYEAYFRVVINSTPTDAGAVTVKPMGFKIEPINAKVQIPLETAFDEGYFRIVRGATINGTPSTISTIWFKLIDIVHDGSFTYYTGEALDNSYLSIAANSNYQTVIETTLTGADHTIVPNYEGAAAWKAYKFYPAGKNIVLSPRRKLFTILQQKYLLFAAEDGWDGVNSNLFFFVPSQTRAKDYDLIDPLFTFNFHNESRRVIWRDESNSVHSLGNADAIIHNLGYLESTAADPIDASTPFDQGAGSKSRKLPVHLKYRTGDYITAYDKNPGGNFSISIRIKVTEVLDTNATPAWYQIIEHLDYLNTTEGGAMPSTIEAAAPYTPLATGSFDGTLSTNDNNLQAAMETIDDHTHEGSGVPIDAPTATDDFLIGAQVASVWTWVKNTLAQTITVLRTSLDSIYASSGHSHPGSGAYIAQTEVDWGSTLNQVKKTFTVTDANIDATMYILASVAYEAPTDRDLDEVEMEAFDIKCSAGDGELTLDIESLGASITGKYKINYTAA